MSAAILRMEPSPARTCVTIVTDPSPTLASDSGPHQGQREQEPSKTQVRAYHSSARNPLRASHHLISFSVTGTSCFWNISGTLLPRGLHTCCLLCPEQSSLLTRTWLTFSKYLLECSCSVRPVFQLQTPTSPAFALFSFISHHRIYPLLILVFFTYLLNVLLSKCKVPEGGNFSVLFPATSLAPKTLKYSMNEQTGQRADVK